MPQSRQIATAASVIIAVPRIVRMRVRATKLPLRRRLIARVNVKCCPGEAALDCCDLCAAASSAAAKCLSPPAMPHVRKYVSGRVVKRQHRIVRAWLCTSGVYAEPGVNANVRGGSGS